MRSGHKKAFAKLDIIASAVSIVNAEIAAEIATGAAGTSHSTCGGVRDIIPRMRLSARNRLVGVITEIKLGDIMAHVTIKVGEHPIEERDYAAQRGRDEFASGRYRGRSD